MEGSELTDEEIESIFYDQLTNLNHSTMIGVEPREKLKNTMVSTELQEKTGIYLRETIPEITDKVNAMERAVKIIIGLQEKVSSRNRRQQLSNENRREKEK